MEVPGSCGCPGLSDGSKEFYNNPLLFCQKRIDTWSQPKPCRKEEHAANEKTTELEHGRVFKTQLILKKSVVLCSHEAVKSMSGEKHAIFENSMEQYFGKLFGTESILFMEAHKANILRGKLRSVLADEATYEMIKPGIDLHVKQCLDNMPIESPIDIYDRLKKMVIAICVEALLGVNAADPFNQEVADLATQHWHGMIALPLDIPCPFVSNSFRHSLQAKERLEQIIKVCLDNPNPVSILNLLKDKLTRSECVSTMLLFIAALITKGVSSILTHIIVLEPLWREQLAKSPNKHETIQAMMYEVQRMYPPFLGGRRTAQSDVVLDKYMIPKHWPVISIVPLAHRDPKAFTNPNTFDPQRWLPPNAESPSKILTFGSGERECAGRQFAHKLIIQLSESIIQRFTWTVINSPLKGETHIFKPLDNHVKWLPVCRLKDKPTIVLTPIQLQNISNPFLSYLVYQ